MGAGAGYLNTQTIISQVVQNEKVINTDHFSPWRSWAALISATLLRKGD